MLNWDENDKQKYEKLSSKADDDSDQDQDQNNEDELRKIKLRLRKQIVEKRNYDL